MAYNELEPELKSILSSSTTKEEILHHAYLVQKGQIEC